MNTSVSTAKNHLTGIIGMSMLNTELPMKSPFNCSGMVFLVNLQLTSRHTHSTLRLMVKGMFMSKTIWKTVETTKLCSKFQTFASIHRSCLWNNLNFLVVPNKANKDFRSQYLASKALALFLFRRFGSRRRLLLSTASKQFDASKAGAWAVNNKICCLTNTPSRSTITRLFNDYSRAESCNPHKTHESPLQNCSAAGFTYALKQPKRLISSGFRA